MLFYCSCFLLVISSTFSNSELAELNGKTKLFLGSRTKIMLIFTLTLLFAEEILALSSETAVASLLVALLGAFVTAALPYTVQSAVSVKASLQCFSLIFLTRVAAAVVPALFLPPSLLLITVYGVILVICIIYIIERRLPGDSFGLNFSNIPVQILGGLTLGAAMGFTEFIILSSDIKRYLLFSDFSIANFVVVLIVMFWFVGLGEELLFRGLVQTSLERDIGNPTVALTIVSLVFSVMHLGYVTGLEKIMELVYVYAAATIIGYAFMKSRSLMFPVIAHGVANTILFGVLPYIL
jgi:membrane protease YdiL (CAAX protease family)